MTQIVVLMRLSGPPILHYSARNHSSIDRCDSHSVDSAIRRDRSLWRRPTDLPFRWPWQWFRPHRHQPSAHPSWPESEGISFGELKKILSETPDEEQARKWSDYYTAGPHLAGKNLSQAEWTRDLWDSFGVSSEVVPYEVYINYPDDHGLVLYKDGKVSFRATLEEDVLEEDPTTSLPNRVPTFHGYSASGNVTGRYVYANYGTFRDYEDLVNAGIDLKGKIALVKYGGVFRGLKVKRAEELGMIGCIIYTDPGDDGEVTEENGFKAYPDGPARNPSSVQRGSVQYLSKWPLIDLWTSLIVQASLLVTQQPSDIHQSPACLAILPTSPRPPFLRSQYHTRKRSLFCAL